MLICKTPDHRPPILRVEAGPSWVQGLQAPWLLNHTPTLHRLLPIVSGPRASLPYIGMPSFPRSPSTLNGCVRLCLPHWLTSAAGLLLTSVGALWLSLGFLCSHLCPQNLPREFVSRNSRFPSPPPPKKMSKIFISLFAFPYFRMHRQTSPSLTSMLFIPRHWWGKSKPFRHRAESIFIDHISLNFHTLPEKFIPSHKSVQP